MAALRFCCQKSASTFLRLFLHQRLHAQHRVSLLRQEAQQLLGIAGDGLVADHVAEVVDAQHLLGGGVEPGGHVVWMPKELKDDVAPRLNKTAKELYGIDNFADMIADETITTDSAELVDFLTEKGHPALGMDPIM